MLVGLVTTILIFLALVGYGSIFQHALARVFAVQSSISLFRQALWGLIFLTWLALILNFFIPLSSAVSLTVIIIGVALGIRVRWVHLNWLSNWKWILLSLIGLLLITGYALDYRAYGDVIFYHLGTVWWAQNSNVVIGLGNIHDRFAFNSMWPLLSVITQPHWPAQQFINHLSSVLLFILSGVLLTEWREKKALKNSLKVLSLSLFFVLWLVWGKHPLFYGLGTVYPDFASSITTVLALFYLAFFLSENTDVHASAHAQTAANTLPVATKISESLLLSAALATTSILFKISQIPLLAIDTYLLYFIWRAQAGSQTAGRFKLFLKLFFKLSLLASPLALLLLRNFLTSGCWIYPAGATCQPKVFWTVPENIWHETYLWVKSWARNPGAPFEQVLANNDWLAIWWSQNITKSYFIFSLATLGLLAVLFIARFATTSFSTAKSHSRKNISDLFSPWAPLLFINILLLLFWWVNAPDLRFASGSFIFITALALTYCGKFLSETFRIPDLFRKLGFVLLTIASLALAQDLVRITTQSFKDSPVQFVGYKDSDFCGFETHTSTAGVKYFIPHCPPEKEVGCWLHEQPCVDHDKPMLKESQYGLWKIYYVE